MPDGEVALVTGGNTGVGFEVVRALAERGMVVYLASRDPAKGETAAAELAGAGDVRPVRLEMTDPSSFPPVLAASSTSLRAVGRRWCRGRACPTPTAPRRRR